jgi:hypothetical protein
MEGIPLMTLNEKGYFITLVLQNLSHIFIFRSIFHIYLYNSHATKPNDQSNWMIVFTKNHCLGI